MTNFIKSAEDLVKRFSTPAVTTQQTPYQQNVSQPVQQNWYKGNKPTFRETLGKIYQINQTDPQEGSRLQKGLQSRFSDSTSMFYAPYTKATNQAVANLQSYGIDTTQEGWYDAYSFLKGDYILSDVTNKPTKPGKKATAQQKAAYEYYEYGNAIDNTQKAKTESAALREELTYWAQRKDRNLSDDQIINEKVNWSKYPTLAEMNDRAKAGTPLPLNEAVDQATNDWMYGVMWAARNNGGTGNIYNDMAMSALGQGNVWQENPTITAKLNKMNRDTYSPYSVGSTLEQEGLYFGMSSFNDETIEQLANNLNWNDATAVKMWNNVKDAEEFTKQAEKELASANEWLNKQLQNVKDQEGADRVFEDFKKKLDNRWETLKKMDDSLTSTNLLGTTRAIDYSLNDVKRRIYDTAAKNSGIPDSHDMEKEVGATGITDQNVATMRSEDDQVRKTSLMMEGYLTDAEQNKFTNASSTTTRGTATMMQQITQQRLVGLVEQFQGKVASDYLNSFIPLYADVEAGKEAEKGLAELEKTNREYADRCDMIRNAAMTGGTDIANIIYNIDDGETVKNGGAYVPNADYTPSLLKLYETVTGQSATIDGFIREGVIDQAKTFYDYIRNYQPTYEEDEGTPWLLKQSKQEYEETIERTAGAQKKMDEQKQFLQGRIDACEQLGVDATRYKTALAVSDALPFLGEYQATQWKAYNKYELMLQDKESGHTLEEVLATAAEGSKQVAEELENARWLKEYLNENQIQLPDNYMSNLDRYIGLLERDQRDTDYFLLQKNADFAQGAQKGREMEATGDWGDSDPQSILQFPESDPYGAFGVLTEGLESSPYYDLLSEAEKDTFYYLLSQKDGVTKAGEFYQNLIDPTYGKMTVRNRRAVEEGAAEEVKSGTLGAIWANVKAVLSAPLEAIGGLTYMLHVAMTNDEFNPNNPLLMSGQYSQIVNQQTAEKIKASAPEGPLRDIAMGGYEILYNYGRSMVNSVMTGGLSIGGRFGDMLTELAGSVPMATGAMAMAVADAKDKGVDDATAFAIGLVTFAMEDLTEGVTRSNIMEAIKGGGEGAVRSVSDLLKEWITSSGIEEAVGETLTEYVEKYVDENLLGAKSDHARLVQDYIEKLKLNPENEADIEWAEELARQDEIGGLAHTFLISFMSPAMNVLTANIRDRVNDFHNIRLTTRELQQHGINTSMSQVRKEYQAWKQQAQQEAQNAPTQPTSRDRMDAVAAETLPAAAEQVKQQQAQTPEEAALSASDREFLAALSCIDAAAGKDANSQTAALGALFGADADSPVGDIAMAAATNAARLTNGSSADMMDMVKSVLTGAKNSGLGAADVKTALQTAALSTKSEAAQVVQSEAFQSAVMEEKAQMLVGTILQDAQNAAVQEEIGKNVYEARVAEQEAEIIKTGALKPVEDAQKAYDKAYNTLQQAFDALMDRQNERQAKADALTIAANEMTQNPNDENKKNVDRALNELDAAIAHEQEYETHYENNTNALNDAAKGLNETKEKVMADIRQQAEAAVQDIDRNRAEIAAQQAAQQQIEAEAMAKMQAEEDQRSGKAEEDRTNGLIEDILNQQRLEGTEREEQRQKLQGQVEKIKLGKIDMTGLMNNTEGYLAVSAFGRKLGLEFKLSDSLPDTARGKYENGVVYLNNNLVKNGNMTIGQALVEASLHEITHSMEATNNYKNYRSIVLESLFHGDESAYQAAIKQKQEDYMESVHQELSPMAADREIVADFARTKLNDKAVVTRFMDNGMGGKMRNTLHNINQSIKNFRLTGNERKEAEYLRRAERSFQKAMVEVANNNVHPAGGQFSVAQFAQAAGLTFNEVEQTLHDKNGNIIDGVTNHVTPDMLKETPVGKLVDSGIRSGTITAEKATKITEQFSQLMDMCARYRQSDMIWEIASATLDSEFSAIKANSDKQYSTTVDFGTICAKTQAIVDQLSRNMLVLGHGLDIKEILQVYNDVYNADLTVPCPVCYVFSRWMGVPSLLNSMKDYQDRFLGKQDSPISVEETQARVDEYIKEAQTQYGIDADFGVRVANAKKSLQDKIDATTATIGVLEQDVLRKREILDERTKSGKTTAQAASRLASAEKKLADARQKLSDQQTDYNNVEVNSYGKAINKVKATLDSKVKAVLDQIDGGDTGNGLTRKIADAKRRGEDTTAMEEKLNALYDRYNELNKERAKVDGYNWVTQSLCRLDENGRFVVDEAFTRTKDEVLLDLNRTAEFAKDAKNWKYRTTRGAGMGKAILPYSGASIGDSIYGVNARRGENALLDSVFNPGEIDNALASAMEKARRQNLIGGQRFQSTSDYRPEWGLDYIMTFIEQQAIGSCGQLYTKVKEAVPLFAKAGIDTNLSVMPFGDGYHLDENGEVVLDFSDVTGMNINEAINLKNQYDNVQLILVGINDTHILAALRDGDIDFVIPWHSSGNSRDQLTSMMASVKEQLHESSDYTKLQSDTKYEGETALVEAAQAKVKNGEELDAKDIAALDRENRRNVREKIITGGFLKKAPTQTEMRTINSSEFLSSLYHRFYEDETSDCYHVKLTSSQASQIFPYEYWQTDTSKAGGTKATADENGIRFCNYCTELGYVPRFSGRDVEITNDDGTKETVNYGNFSGMTVDENGDLHFNPVQGYWKLLIDRSMYDLQGNYRNQQKIDVTNINPGELVTNPETGRLSLSEDSDIKMKTEAKYSLDNPDIVNAHKRASKAFDARMKISTGTTAYDNSYQFSTYGDLTKSDIEQLVRQADSDYMDAVNSGDMEAAQEDVDYVAEQMGYTVRAYHGTPTGGFTVFDLSKINNGRAFGNGIYFSSSENVASNFMVPTGRTKGEINPKLYDTYLNLGDRPYVVDVDELREENKNKPSLVNYLMNEKVKNAPEDATSIIIEGIYDGSEEKSTVYVIKDPSQVKSAETVTYDDQGNVIPLSERFNQKNSDIRYSAGGEMTTADLEQMLSNNNQTETEEFKNWFGDSKVVNDDNSPMIVYHGTSEDFTAFDMSKGRSTMDIQGAFFSPWTEDAEGYGEKVGAYYLSIQNPADEKTAYAALARFKGQNEAGKKAREYLISQGYDGVINGVPGQPEEFIAFYPTQIKSATDNVGTFDRTNPDYRYSSGGELTDADLEQMVSELGRDTVSKEDIDTIQSLIEGKTQQEIRETISGLVREARAAKNELAKQARELRKMAEEESVKDALSRIDKKTLRIATNSIADVWPSGISKAEISDRFSEMALMISSGQDITDVARTLADSVYNTMDTDNEMLRDLRGLTIVIGPGQRRELEASDSSITELRKELAGTGIKLQYGDYSSLDSDKEDLMARFPGMPDFGEEKDSLDAFVSWVTRLKELSRKDAQQNVDPDSIFEEIMGMAYTIQVSKSSGKPRQNKRAQKFESLANKAEDVRSRLGDVVKTGEVTSNEIEGMYDDLSTAIDFFRNVAEHRAEIRQQNHDVDIIESMETFADEQNTDDNFSDMNALIESGAVTEEEINQYNGIPAAPAETVPQGDNLPGTTGMRPQRQFGHKTSQESDALHEEVKQYLYNHSSYTPDTNAAQIDRAMDWVQQHANTADPEGYYAALQEAESADFDYRSADGQARMLTLMGMAALKGDTASELRLADAYNKQGTDLGRMLQARKLFRLMTPLGRVSTLQQEVNRINDDYARQGSNRRVGLSEWTLRAAEVAETEEDFQKVQHAAAQELAEQMPANWKDKLTGWRMLSMLGNPRTHIRNVLGNALFMPMVGIKNEIAALAELGMKKENRTKTVGLATQDARAFAKQDAQAIRDTLTGEAKYKDGDLVQQERKTWGTGKSLISRTLGKALQGASDLNSKALEAEDWIFLNRHYRNALAGYMTARGLTSKDMTGKTLEDARIYAVQEAQKATYRDANKLASDLSKIGQRGGAVGFVVNAVLPFKKTPANILKRGLEYSPAGIMKALTADAKHLKQYMDYQNGKLGSLPEKAISPSQWIDKICSGLTGSAVMALGFLLSGMGAVKAGLDDDDEFDKLQGEQEYSINPGKILNKMFNVELFGEDVSMTADWAAPFSMPFFVGATLYNALNTLNGGKEINVGAVADSILNITEPVFNLSMLDGVNSLLDVNAYGDGNPITKIVEKIATNYLTSFVPTLSGQAARTIDPVRRKAYVESGAEPSAILYALEQLENKLPFVSKSNIPYRNAWGEASEKEQLTAGLENFLSPAYFNTIKNDAVTNELERLYNTVSDTNRSAMVPKMPSKTIGGEKLNAEQYDQLTVERGQTAKKLLTELMGDEAYAIADDETRAEMIKDVWTYCNQTANYNVSGGTTNVDKWVTAAKDDPVGAVVNRAVDRAKKEQTEGFTTQLKRAFAGGNLEDAQTAIAGLRRAGKSDSSIKSSVTNIAKPIYQAAYLADDDDTMYEVEMMLDNLDDDLVWKYSGWLKNLDDVEEEEEEEPLEINWLNRNQ